MYTGIHFDHIIQNKYCLSLQFHSFHRQWFWVCFVSETGYFYLVYCLINICVVAFRKFI